MFPQLSAVKSKSGGRLENFADGPAFIDGDCQEWYLNHIEYQFNEWVNEIDATPEEKIMLRLKCGIQ